MLNLCCKRKCFDFLVILMWRRKKMRRKMKRKRRRKRRSNKRKKKRKRGGRGVDKASCARREGLEFI